MANGIVQPKLDANAVMPIIAGLMAANTASYPRLQTRLEQLTQAIQQSKNIKNAQNAVLEFLKFVNEYRPIDPKMQAFLKSYGQSNIDLLNKLKQSVFINDEQQLVQNSTESKPEYKAPKINVKKFGLFRFPFMSYDQLDLGDLSIYKTIKSPVSFNTIPMKLWKDINGVPFLINGYVDDAYSAVNRVLAAQAGKLLGLQCEEVFFGHLNDKLVTATAFHDAVTLLENQTFQLYPMTSNYDYQSEQKRAFYFLIQHWTAYALVNNQVRERFERHFIDSNGNVFLSQHEFATFLTPEQMTTALMVRLRITRDNYTPIKDLMLRIGDRDLADIVFSSISPEMIECHDEVANNLNKPSFDNKRESFDANFEKLKKALVEFENTFGV